MARADVVQLMENGKKKYVKTHYGAIDGVTYSLRKGEDLNNLKEAGIYYVTRNADADTLLNCPTHHAFKLDVTPVSGESFVYQTLTSWQSGTVYVRSFYGYGNTWQPWKPIGKENTKWEAVRTFGGLNVGDGADYEGIKTAYISGVPFITFQSINWPRKTLTEAWQLVGNLPDHLRPTHDLKFPLAQTDPQSKGSTLREMIMSITRLGNIYILTNTSADAWYSCAPFPLI